MHKESSGTSQNNYDVLSPIREKRKEEMIDSNKEGDIKELRNSLFSPHSVWDNNWDSSGI